MSQERVHNFIVLHMSDSIDLKQVATEFIVAWERCRYVFSHCE